MVRVVAVLDDRAHGVHVAALKEVVARRLPVHAVDEVCDKELGVGGGTVHGEALVGGAAAETSAQEVRCVHAEVARHGGKRQQNLAHPETHDNVSPVLK